MYISDPVFMIIERKTLYILDPHFQGIIYFIVFLDPILDPALSTHMTFW